MSENAAPLLARWTRAATEFRQQPEARQPAVTPSVTVLFTGTCVPRPGLGRELYTAYPVVRPAYDAVRAALDPWLRLPLAAVVFAPQGGVDADLIRRSEYAQPALFAFHVALFKLWQLWGLRAGAVAGTGPGALAAAHVAGMLTLADAARLVAARGRLVPHRTVTAADARSAAEARSAFLQAARESAPAPPAVPLLCADTGRRIGPGPGQSPLTPGHLLHQVRHAVRSIDAVRALKAAGFPQPHLCGPDPEDARPGSEIRAALTGLHRLHDHPGS
ncbi:acyltransferase domain-containing protein [Streptomyces agglomeratus]|uniref:acyltransferase domain-containing protein n=1 Tax=Streptomyces agglomeratus TaxID=285458 RepID=UPI000854E279|nr:acyltransferase domain-containing protein [Streptomyces agglomeratus]OEJ36268.1 hypothetical protein BGK72_38540 [Streptomyces agglomeratus]